MAPHGLKKKKGVCGEDKNIFSYASVFAQSTGGIKNRSFPPVWVSGDGEVGRQVIWVRFYIVYLCKLFNFFLMCRIKD